MSNNLNTLIDEALDCLIAQKIGWRIDHNANMLDQNNTVQWSNCPTDGTAWAEAWRIGIIKHYSSDSFIFMLNIALERFSVEFKKSPTTCFCTLTQQDVSSGGLVLKGEGNTIPLALGRAYVQGS